MHNEYSIADSLGVSLKAHGISVADLVLYINSACNLRCKHCYVGNALLSSSTSIDSRSATQLIENLSPLDRITILGGEPLLYKHINTVVQKAIDCQIAERRITTNLTELFFFDYARFSNKGVRLAVSVDGHSSELHDSIRGKGTFERTVRNIKRMLQIGYDLEVTHTINSDNIHYFWDFVEFLVSIGVRRLNLHKISMQGNAVDNQKLFVSAGTWVSFLNELKMASASGVDGSLEVRVPVLYVTKCEFQNLMNDGIYSHHAQGSFYGSRRGARIVIYPDRRLYISSELFGTGSHIGSIEDGKFVYNDSVSNELEFFGRITTGDSIERLNPSFADIDGGLVPLSVSFKQTMHL